MIDVNNSIKPVTRITLRQTLCEVISNIQSLGGAIVKWTPEVLLKQ